MTETKAVELTCPRCGKLLGKTRDTRLVAALLLWCRRCHREVTPHAK